MTKITAERLKQIVNYDPNNGQFTWAQARKKCTKGAVAGYSDKRTGYKYVRLDWVIYAQHRLAWLYMYGRWPDGELDHINHDTGDNRIANLRECVDGVVNQHNKQAPKNNTSGYVGVDFHKASGKWRARIKAGETYHHLGLFDTAEEANEVRLAAKQKYHFKSLS